MHQLLKINQVVRTANDGSLCVVEAFLGAGTQGEVYQVAVADKKLALKWYFPETLQNDSRLRERLEVAIASGAPSDRYLWPIELVIGDNIQGFGYLMPLRERRFRGIVDLMRGRVEPSFRALTTAGLELAHHYLQLHSQGYCYRDISFGNIFFDPVTGEVRICDNDNVDVDAELLGGVLGTPRFMAPEIVRGEAKPSRYTDLYSLAVLLFYMFMIHHPLEGRREQDIHCLDPAAMTKLYGTNPVFIFDPENDSNRPVAVEQATPLKYWPIYPQILRDTFIHAFTAGITDPKHGRVAEGEWRRVMLRLRDSIMYCSNCGEENFYDPPSSTANVQGPMSCWSCCQTLHAPVRMRIEKDVIVLNPDTCLYPHHLDPGRSYDFSTPLAEVTQHPTKANVLGLKNLSSEKWVFATSDGAALKDVEPGRSAALIAGATINFGKVQGVIRV
jgi:eukaryotic-like serine/threonine-protein kinase